MSDRGYKVIYKSRASDSTDDQLSPQRSRRDYGYYDDDDDDDDDGYGTRKDRDVMSMRSVQGSANVVDAGPGRTLTKTTYEVGRSRNDDLYVRGGNAVVIDQPKRRRGESESEWEVIQPERNHDGAYVIEMGAESGERRGGRRYDYEVEILGGRNRGQIIEAGRLGRGREVEVLTPAVRRDRSMSRGMIEAMQQVQITEEYSSEDDRRSRLSRRGRSIIDVDTTAATGAVSLMKRTPSAFRHDHSPSSDINRRSRSVGFRKKDIENHDVSESRHERPGAEAHLAGKYLVGHRGEYIKQGSDDESVISGLRRSRTEGNDRYGEEVERRKDQGYYRDERYSYDEYEREGPYEPQRQPPRRRRHHRHRDDDDQSRYSEYYEKKTKRYS